MSLKFYKKNLGFTLIETMVAISILSMSILGTFTAVQSALQNSTFAKDQVTAFYLVQEVMEFMRNTRDSNNLYSIANPSTPHDWLYGISGPGDPCEFGKVCRVDVPANGAMTRCGDSFGTCPVITQDINPDSTGSGLFGYGYARPTHFRREVQLQPISATEIVVRVKISWSSGVFNKNFQVEQTLMNWQ